MSIKITTTWEYTCYNCAAPIATQVFQRFGSMAEQQPNLSALLGPRGEVYCEVCLQACERALDEVRTAR